MGSDGEAIQLEGRKLNKVNAKRTFLIEEKYALDGIRAKATRCDQLYPIQAQQVALREEISCKVLSQVPRHFVDARKTGLLDGFTVIAQPPQKTVRRSCMRQNFGWRVLIPRRYSSGLTANFDSDPRQKREGGN